MNKIHFLKQKFWFFLLVSSVIVLSLSACNSSQVEGTPTPTDENNDPPQATSTPIPRQETPTPTMPQPVLDVDPEDLDGLSIRFIHPYNGEIGEVIEEIAMTFSLSNPWGIWVEVEGLGSENLLLETVQSDIDQGEQPALVAAHGYTISWLEGDYASIPLTAYFNHPDWGFDSASQEDIPQVFLDQYTLGGEIIALPIAPQAKVLFYNQTWAENLGFDSHPVDEDSFAAQACGATAANLNDINENNDFTGGWLMNYDPWVLLSWYSAFGGEVPKSEVPQFNTDAGVSAFGYLESLYSPERNCIWVGRQAEPYWYFANRYALMYAGNLSQISLQRGWMEQAQNDDQWIATGFPGSDGEVMLVDSPGLFITEGSTETQLGAWLFAKHLLTPEIQARLVQSLFTLPVRSSAIDYLEDFVIENPQWMDALELVVGAGHLPVSTGWGYGRWILQDAIIRSFAIEDEDVSAVLEELDQMILELEGISP